MAPIPRLPHQDQPEPRNRALERARRKWRYHYDHLPGLVFSERVPDEAEPSRAWVCELLERLEQIAANERANGFDIGNFAMFSGLALKLRKAFGLGNRTPTRATGRTDFDALFQTIRKPAIADSVHDDATFTHLRLAGPNPVLLRRVDHLPDHFPVTDAHLRLRPECDDDSLAAAGAEGRLYQLDHRVFDGVEDGFTPYGTLQKLSYAPLTLFVVPPGRGVRALLPVAIQCAQRTNRYTPILTPEHGWAWQMAKTVVNAADGMYHELISHLARTHLTIEPIVVATHRNLAPNHPLHLLLTPHFEGTVQINALGHQALLRPDGVVDSLLAPTLEASLGIVADQVRNTDFTRSALPDDLEARKMTDPDLRYPYRDDALPIWAAIEAWVTDYLSLYYRGDADVARDPELRAFLEELIAADGGRARGIGCEVACPTIAQLIRFVTTTLFLASAQHAAVNFPQFDVMAYQPAMSLALYGAAPTRVSGYDAADWLALQPPLESAEIQLNLGHLLGTVHYTRLGHYASDHFTDPRTAEPLRRFTDRLIDIEKDIHRRNRTGRPYVTLIPRTIPQSINI